jgi:hypothetical protein
MTDQQPPQGDFAAAERAEPQGPPRDFAGGAKRQPPSPPEHRTEAGPS